MFLEKKISIIVLQIFFCTIALSQREKIDSLKKTLPSLHDSARVDCLNALCEAYLRVNEPVRPVQYRNIVGDTAADYAKLAYEEAPDPTNKNSMKAAIEKLEKGQDMN